MNFFNTLRQKLQSAPPPPMPWDFTELNPQTTKASLQILDLYRTPEIFAQPPHSRTYPMTFNIEEIVDLANLVV